MFKKHSGPYNSRALTQGHCCHCGHHSQTCEQQRSEKSPHSVRHVFPKLTIRHKVHQTSEDRIRSKVYIQSVNERIRKKKQFDYISIINDFKLAQILSVTCLLLSNIKIHSRLVLWHCEAVYCVYQSFMRFTLWFPQITLVPSEVHMFRWHPVYQGHSLWDRAHKL